jgi:hypothetical protein
VRWQTLKKIKLAEAPGWLFRRETHDIWEKEGRQVNPARTRI